MPGRALVAGVEGRLRRELVRTLEEQGHRVQTVDTVEAALEALARRSPFEVVVCDEDAPARIAGLTCRSVLRRARDLSPGAMRVLATARRDALWREDELVEAVVEKDAPPRPIVPLGRGR